jgi:predicted transcriptional regulator
MSIAASNWVWEVNLPSSEKKVLLWLAHVANADNASWYGVNKIAKQCNISCRTAQRAIASLVKSGHLITKRRIKLDGSYDSNMYILPIQESTDKLTLTCTPLALPI